MALTASQRTARMGARDIVASLLERYQRPVVAYLVRLVDDPQWAEDLAEESFHTALRSESQLPGIPGRRAWLYRIVTDTASKALRRRRRFTWLEPRKVSRDRRSEAGAGDHAAHRDRVESALAGLPAEQRAPLLLFSHDELSLPEIATVLGITEAAARTRLYRARVLFREAYEREMADASHVEIKERLAAYESLDGEEQIELNGHIAGCAGCGRELAAYRRMDRALRHLPNPQSSARLQAVISQALAPVEATAQASVKPQQLSPAQPRAKREPEPEAVEDVPANRSVTPDWRRLLVPLALALLFAGSLWFGMRGEEEPNRSRIDAEPTPAGVNTPENVKLPVPPTEAPLTIDARGHVTITFACDDLVILSPEYHALARAFQDENPDVTVKFVGWEQARQEWQHRTGNLAGESHNDTMRAIAGGSDVFCAGGDDRQLIREGLVRNLMPLARADTAFAIDEFYPEVLEQGADAGGLYLIPARFRPALIRYDPAAFKAAGLRTPHPGWSWDDLLNAAAALTVRDGGNTRRWGFGERNDNNVMLARYWSAISPLQFRSSLARGNPLENGDVLDLFRWYDEFYLQARVAPIPPRLANSSADAASRLYYPEQIRRGRFAMWTDELEASPPEGMRAVPFPVSRAFDKTTPVGAVDMWVISSEAQYIDAAWRWVSFISQNLPDSPGSGVPARRSAPQMQAFWKIVAPEDRDSYQYALEHLGNWPVMSDLDGSLQLWGALLSMIRGQTSLAALTAPGGPKAAGGVEPSQVITLSFAAPRDQKADYQRAAAVFAKINPGIRIRIVPSEELLPSRSGTEVLWNQMRVLASRVDAMVNAQVPELVRSGRAQGILYDVTQMISKTLQASDYYPNALEGLQWRGRAFALPGRLDVQLIYYHQWMFDQMGVAYPQPGWTWTDFDRTVRAVALTGKGNSNWWGFGDGIDNGLDLLKSRLGDLVDYSTSRGTPRLDSSTAIEAAAWYAKLLRDGVVAPAGRSIDEAAMWVAPADFERLDDLREEGISVAPFPIDPGSAATTPLEIYDAFAISANARYPEIAWQWLLYLQLDASGGETRHQGIPARRNSRSATKLPENPELRGVVEYALEHMQRPAPLRPEEYFAVQQLTAALERIVQDGQEASAAMQEAQAAAQKALGRR